MGAGRGRAKRTQIFHKQADTPERTAQRLLADASPFDLTPLHSWGTSSLSGDLKSIEKGQAYVEALRIAFRNDSQLFWQKFSASLRSIPSGGDLKETLFLNLLNNLAQDDPVSTRKAMENIPAGAREQLWGYVAAPSGHWLYLERLRTQWSRDDGAHQLQQRAARESSPVSF